MKSVNFTEMKNGSKEDYLLLDKHEKKYIEGTADRLMKFMSGQCNTLEGYKITRLEHSLQTATRALNDKADDEMIVATLFHDIGDELAPVNHSEYAAAVLMTSKKVMQAQRKVFEREGIIQMQLNGAQSGQTVFHYHIHLIPSSIHELGRHAVAQADQSELTNIAKQLAAAISDA